MTARPPADAATVSLPHIYTTPLTVPVGRPSREGTRDAAADDAPQPARVLLVDDEPRVLDALSRILRRTFDVTAVPSGALALVAMRDRGPFEVLVADMRMPEMDGVTLLHEACVHAPDTVRILLTGQADLDAAIGAVNEGHVFRFLQKPCAPDTIVAAIEAAVVQHRLVTAERVLLEETLNGSVQVLADVLALVKPAAFSRALRLRRTVGELCAALKVPDAWQPELAALLSQLGCIVLPDTTLERVHRGDALSDREQALVDSVPETTQRLLAHIPRLEPVLVILRHQAGQTESAGPAARRVEMPVGARLLKLATDFDILEAQGNSLEHTLETLEGRTGVYDTAALRALRMLRHVAARTTVVREMPLSEVQVGMVFATDVMTASGVLLVARGQEVTRGVAARIANWARVPLRATPRLLVKVAP